MALLRTWLGKMRTGEAAIAFPEPTLCRGDAPARTGVQWWRIRRIFGFGSKRFILALIVVDMPVAKVMIPDPFAKDQ